MRDKNSNLVANRLVKAFLKNKIINSQSRTIFMFSSNITQINETI